MAHHERKGVPSTAAVVGHPIHPMLIPFPIAFLVGALAADLVYWNVPDPFWAYMAVWLVGAGFVTGILAAAAGVIDFFTIDRARAHIDGWIHFIGNAVVLVLAFVSLLIRTADVEGAIVPWGLILSAIITVLLVVTGWYGGELSYRYKIGVLEEEHSAESMSADPSHS